MKGRFLILFLGVVLGVSAGFYAAQRKDARGWALAFGEGIDLMKAEAIRLYSHARGRPEPSPPPPPPVPLMQLRQAFLADTHGYIHDFITVPEEEISATLEKPSYAAVISGLVKNAGNQRLGKVEAMVYFLGSDYSILQESPIELLDGNPLRPKEERRFKAKIPSAPVAWTTGRVRISVVDLSVE